MTTEPRKADLQRMSLSYLSNFLCILSAATTLIATSTAFPTHGSSLTIPIAAHNITNTTHPLLLWPPPPFHSNLGQDMYILIHSIWPARPTTPTYNTHILSAINTVVQIASSDNHPATSRLPYYRDIEGPVVFEMYGFWGTEEWVERKQVVEVLGLLEGLQKAYGIASCARELYKGEKGMARFDLIVMLGEER